MGGGVKRVPELLVSIESERFRVGQPFLVLRSLAKRLDYYFSDRGHFRAFAQHLFRPLTDVKAVNAREANRDGKFFLFHPKNYYKLSLRIR